MNKVNIKFLAALFMAAFIIGSVYSAGRSLAFSDEENIKMKINMEIYNEFYDLMVDNFTDARFEGIAKQTVNGAFMESKYTAYSKDLNYKRIDVVSYGDKFSHVTTPDKVWYYFEKENYVIYYANKKNVARFNSKVYFDSVKDDGKITKTHSDGKITKTHSDGKIIYKLLDYKYNIKQTFVFDGTANKLTLQLVEPDGGEKIETTYKGWDKIKSSKDIFSFPSRAKSKCMDQ
jgi:hypothetical protein